MTHSSISLINNNIFSTQQIKELESLIRWVLEFFEISAIELSIKFVTVDEITNLNRIYRGIDRETDIISFPSDEFNPDTGFKYLGDIAIANDVARKNAITENKTFFDEIKFLIVHGLLHLLGYNDETTDGFNEMISLQKKLLSSFQEKYAKIH